MSSNQSGPRKNVQKSIPHICMVVTTDFIHDRRVRKEALSVLLAGYRLTVVATKRPEDAAYGSGGSGANADDEFADYPMTLKRVNLGGRMRKINLPLFSTAVTIFWAIFSYLKIMAAIFSVRADIYHCHDIDALALARLPALFHRAKVIFDCHDIMSEIQIEGSVLAKIRPVIKFLERRLPKTAHGLVAAAPPFAKRIEDDCGIASETILPVLNCPRIHAEQNANLLRKEFGIDDTRPVLLYLGSINPDRGLIHLLAILDQLHPSIAVILKGPGHQEIREKLIARIKSLSTGDRVFLGDFVPLEDVPATLMSADATIIPNRYISEAYNSLPNKLFEAMMAGRPFVCNDIPAMAKIVREENSGLVLADEDPKTLTDELNRLLLDQNLCEKLGRNGRRAAERTYNWESQASKITQLYTSLLASR